MAERDFQNPYPEYDPATKIFDFTTNKLSCEIEGPLLKNVFSLLDSLEKRLPSEIDWSDTSVYTGTTGIALMYMHFMDIEQCQGKRDYLKSALQYVEPILSQLKKKRLSFLCGVTGPLAVCSVLYHREGNRGASNGLARRVENLGPDACSYMTDCPDELLYGRVGYLFSLLFLEKHIQEDKFRDHTMKEVVSAVLESGQRMAYKPKNSKKMPLFYEWHDKAYVGSAHGFAGILYMLLQAQEYLSKEQIDTFLRPTIDHILNLQFPSGNFPSSVENSTDRLVHWCHGAPGVVHLFLLAYIVFQDDKYLNASKACGEVIWQRGILKKGYGLCHGTAGNGYAHLRLFQVTKDPKYLYRALKFAEWCFDYGKHGCRAPDRPLSLFEGLAGTIYFLLDLLKPLDSAFPAFQLC